MSKAIRRFTVLCAAVAALSAIAVAPAVGATSDPLFIVKAVPPAAGPFEGPCGLAVAPSNGNFYVSDYYNHTIDIYKPETLPGGVLTALPAGGIGPVDPLNGPCGLSISTTGTVYVNNFHSNVTNLGSNTILPLPALETATHLPTGVAIDTTTNRVYVNNRTYVTAFEATGAQVMDGPEPLRIGLGNLGDAYGLAATPAGKVYVPDAATNTVKVFEPTVDKGTPVATIKGPGKGFVSLQDSSVAVDYSTGVIYVIDNLQPIYTEQSEAVVYVYSSANVLLGVLKYKIFDALPPGIAVDNSGGATQGRVYVTSGNTDLAGVYAYGPGAQTGSFFPPTVGMTVKMTGGGSGVVRSATPEVDCADSCSAQVLAGSELSLTATPDPSSTFAGWSGAGCSGTGACTVTMDEAASVSAEFTTNSPPSTPPPPDQASPVTSPAAVASTQQQQARRNHKAKHKRKAKQRRKAKQHRSGQRR